MTTEREEFEKLVEPIWCKGFDQEIDDKEVFKNIDQIKGFLMAIKSFKSDLLEQTEDKK